MPRLTKRNRYTFRELAGSPRRDYCGRHRQYRRRNSGCIQSATSVAVKLSVSNWAKFPTLQSPQIPKGGRPAIRPRRSVDRHAALGRVRSAIVRKSAALTTYAQQEPNHARNRKRLPRFMPDKVSCCIEAIIEPANDLAL